MAWLLVYKEKWGLLEALIKRSSEPVNLNAAPVADNHPRKGISVAWLLAGNNKWELLEALIKRSSEPVNLNAAPLADNNPDKGISLAWFLATNKKWELLEALIKRSSEPVNLNAAPMADNHPSKGESFIQLLVKHNQWDIIKTIVTKNPAIIDAEFQEGSPKILTSLLVKADLKDVFEARLNSYDLKKIQNTYEQKNSVYIKECVTIIYANKINENITAADLENFTALQKGEKRNLKSNLNSIFKLLNSISESSSFYKKAMMAMSDILQRLFPFPELCEAMIKLPQLQDLLNEIPQFYSTALSGQDKLKVLSSLYASKAKDLNKVGLIIAELLSTKNRLSSENIQLKEDLARSQQQASSYSKDEATPPRKRRKTNKSAFFTSSETTLDGKSGTTSQAEVNKEQTMKLP